MGKKELFRKLPSIDKLLSAGEMKELGEHYPPERVKDAAREVIDGLRNRILEGDIREEELEPDRIFAAVEERIEGIYEDALYETMNGTGTVVHTNLGRSLLSKDALEHIQRVSGSYSNLEYDIEKGERGSRYDIITDLLIRITGAEDALVVNNNAAAVFLMLHTLARGKETIVSRGELVEIGDSFRISSIMEESGTNLVEVGATNKTHYYDYEEAINENTAVLMKVHTSNFAVLGFHESVGADELVPLKEEYGLPLIEDLGSGTLLDFREFGLSYERTVTDCLEDGIDLVSFSGDKMLGGPQAGIIVGKKKYIDEMKNNQLLRTFRVDKFTLAALESTLKHYLDRDEALREIPTLRMMTISLEEIEEKAVEFSKMLEEIPGVATKIVDSYSKVGGGAFPAEQLPSKTVRIRTDLTAHALEEAFRLSPIHLIGMIRDDCFEVDMRCLFRKDFKRIADTLEEILKE